jgi:hypothetical protein
MAAAAAAAAAARTAAAASARACDKSTLACGGDGDGGADGGGGVGPAAGEEEQRAEIDVAGAPWGPAAPRGGEGVQQRGRDGSQVHALLPKIDRGLRDRVSTLEYIGHGLDCL